MTVRYSRRAVRELDQIFSYIADENPPAAPEQIARIKSVLERLGRFPRMGQRTDDERLRGCLLSPGTKYKAFHDLDGEGVLILHVRHGAQNES